MTAKPSPGQDSRFGAALAALRREVTLGRYKDSDMLPGERDLSDLLGISRTTLRRVLTVLVEDGLLTQRHGVGTFLRHQTVLAESRSPRLAGFSEQVRMQGRLASSRDIECSRALPTPDEAMMLGCQPVEGVIRLSRLRCIDDEPVAIERTVVPRLFIDLPDVIGGSLYDALDRRGFRPVRALQRIQGEHVPDADADRLGVAPGSAAILVRRTTSMADGRTCEFTRSLYRADRYDAVFELKASSAAGDDQRR